MAYFLEKNSNLKKTDLLIGLFLFLFTSVTIFFHASNTIFTLFLPKYTEMNRMISFNIYEIVFGKIPSYKCKLNLLVRLLL